MNLKITTLFVAGALYASDLADLQRRTDRLNAEIPTKQEAIKSIRGDIESVQSQLGKILVGFNLVLQSSDLTEVFVSTLTVDNQEESSLRAQNDLLAQMIEGMKQDIDQAKEEKTKEDRLASLAQQEEQRQARVRIKSEEQREHEKFMAQLNEEASAVMVQLEKAKLEAEEKRKIEE